MDTWQRPSVMGLAEKPCIVSSGGGSPGQMFELSWKIGVQEQHALLARQIASGMISRTHGSAGRVYGASTGHKSAW